MVDYDNPPETWQPFPPKFGIWYSFRRVFFLTKKHLSISIFEGGKKTCDQIHIPIGSMYGIVCHICLDLVDFYGKCR